MADDISDLRLFVRIVSAGSLSEAARRLNSSLPAVSRRLAGLESRLGVRLVDRAPRHFAVTEEGALLYDRGIGILAGIDDVEAEVSLKVRSPRGRLRVSAPLEIGRQRIAPLVGKFTRTYPQIEVELALTDRVLDIVSDELDVGLQIDLPTDGGVIARKLLSSRRVACASPSYIAEHGAPLSPADLKSHECILFVRGRHIYDRWMFQQDGHPREIQVRGPLLTNNGEVMHDWAVAGRGIALKALWDIEEDLSSGRLVELLAPFARNEINLYATYVTRTHLPPRVRVFIDFIAAGLR